MLQEHFIFVVETLRKNITITLPIRNGDDLLDVPAMLYFCCGNVTVTFPQQKYNVAGTSKRASLLRSGNVTVMFYRNISTIHAIKG